MLIYSNQDGNTKSYKAQRYYLPNSFIKNYVLSRMLSSSAKTFSDQVIDSDITRYEEIRKLTTGWGEGYTTEELLDYDYIKNHYRLIAVRLSRQKQLDADPKAI